MPPFQFIAVGQRCDVSMSNQMYLKNLHVVFRGMDWRCGLSTAVSPLLAVEEMSDYCRVSDFDRPDRSEGSR